MYTNRQTRQLGKSFKQFERDFEIEQFMQVAWASGFFTPLFHDCGIVCELAQTARQMTSRKAKWPSMTAHFERRLYVRSKYPVTRVKVKGSRHDTSVMRQTSLSERYRYHCPATLFFRAAFSDRTDAVVLVLGTIQARPRLSKWAMKGEKGPERAGPWT